MAQTIHNGDTTVFTIPKAFTDLTGSVSTDSFLLAEFRFQVFRPREPLRLPRILEGTDRGIRLRAAEA